MIGEFRGFLTKTNALALAVGVIIGAAVSKIVSAFADDILMPIIGVFLPGGSWRDAKIVLGANNAILYGHFLGTCIDFLIISFVLFLIVRQFLKPVPMEPTRHCPECLEVVPAAARRCRACANPLS